MNMIQMLQNSNLRLAFVYAIYCVGNHPKN
jgi:hypothetical protein